MKLLLLLALVLSDSLQIDSLVTQIKNDSTLRKDSAYLVQDSLLTQDSTGNTVDTMLAFKPEHSTKVVSSVAELTKKADKAFIKINYELADSLYSEASQLDSTNADLQWKMARLYVCMGDGIDPHLKEKRAPYYKKAVEHARKSIELNDKSASAYTWLAAALGVSADNSSSKERIKYANDLKAALDKAIKLNPKDDIAYSILGSFYHASADISWYQRFFANTFLGSVPDGSYEESEKAFQKAIELNPTIIRHYYEFALLYMDWDKPKKALELLKKAQTLPVKMKNDRRRKREMKDMIAKLEKEIADK